MLGGTHEYVLLGNLLLEVPHEGKSAKIWKFAERSLLGVDCIDTIKISFIIFPPIEIFFRGIVIPFTKA